MTSKDRSFRQKINKATQVLNDTLDQLDLIDIYKTLHAKTKNKTKKKTRIHIFSSANGPFPRIDHILGQKTSLNKFKKIEIISSILLTTLE